MSTATKFTPNEKQSRIENTLKKQGQQYNPQEFSAHTQQQTVGHTPDNRNNTMFYSQYTNHSNYQPQQQQQFSQQQQQNLSYNYQQPQGNQQYVNESFFEQNQQNLRMQYERRIEDALNNLYQRIANDHLLDTMKQDSASQEYIALRVKEIINENLNHEKEIHINNLSSQIEYLKEQINNLEATALYDKTEYQKDIEHLQNLIKDREEEIQKNKKLSCLEEEEIQHLGQKYKEQNKNLEKRLLNKENELLEVQRDNLNEIKHLKNINKDQIIVLQKKEEEIAQSKKQLIQKLNHIEQLQSQMNKLELEKKTLLIENQNVSNKLQAQSQGQVEIQDLNQELRKTIEQKQFQAEQLESRINFLEEEKQNLVEKIEYIKGETDQKLENQQIKFREANEQLMHKSKEKIQKIKNKNQEIKERMKEMEESFKQDKKNWIEQKDRLKQEISQLEKSIEEIKSQHFNELEEQLQNFNQKLEQNQQNHENYINELQQNHQEQFNLMQLKQDEEKQQLENKINELQQQIILKDQNILESAQIQGKLKGKIEELEKEKKEVENDYSNLIKSKDELIEELRRRVQISESELQKTQEENYQQKQLLDQNQQVIEEQENTLQEQDEELKNLRQIKEENKGESSQLNKQIWNLENEVKQFQEKLQNSEVLVQELRSDRQFQEEGKKQMLNDIKQLEENMNNQLKQTEEIEVNLQEKQNEIASLQQEIMQLNNDKYEMKNDIQQQQEIIQNKEQEIAKQNQTIIEKYQVFEKEKAKKEEAYEQLNIVEKKLYTLQDEIAILNSYLQNSRLEGKQLEKLSQDRLILAEQYKTQLEQQEISFKKSLRIQSDMQNKQNLHKKRVLSHIQKLLKALYDEKNFLKQFVRSNNDQIQVFLKDSFKEIVRFFQQLYSQVLQLTDLEKQKLQLQLENKLDLIKQKFEEEEQLIMNKMSQQLLQQKQESNMQVESLQKKIISSEQEKQDYQILIQQQKELEKERERQTQNLLLEMKQTKQIEIENMKREIEQERQKGNQDKMKYKQKLEQNEIKNRSNKEKLIQQYEQDIHELNIKLQNQQKQERAYLQTTKQAIDHAYDLEDKYNRAEIQKNQLQRSFDEQLNNFESLVQTQKERNIINSMQLRTQELNDLASRSTSLPFTYSNIEQLKSELNLQKRRLEDNKNQLLRSTSPNQSQHMNKSRLTYSNNSRLNQTQRLDVSPSFKQTSPFQPYK